MTYLVTDTTTKMNALAKAGVVKVLARKLGIGQWSFIGPSSEKKVVSFRE